MPAPGFWGKKVMRKRFLSIGAVLLLGLAGNGPASPFGQASAVIAVPEKLLNSRAIDRVDLADPQAPITEYKYDAEFVVTNQLGGPELGKTARISFIDDEKWDRRKRFMVVHRDGLGRLWARRAWQEVDSQLCLSAAQVAKLDLNAAFVSAEHDDQGRRCIRV